MEYKVFEKEDIELMLGFVDDRNTAYKEEDLACFLNDGKTYGFVAKEEGRIIGFAYGYKLLKPDGITDFYLHSIDVMKEYQNQGHGTELMNYINEYIKEAGCRKMFLVTNKGNIAACKCYEKSGGLTKANDVNVGDIIEYNMGDFTVIHRIIEKVQRNGSYYFVTKGDNNTARDLEDVKEDQLIGKVVFKIRYIGYPAVWLHIERQQEAFDSV